MSRSARIRPIWEAEMPMSESALASWEWLQWLTGTFVAVPLEEGLPSFTGKFTIWGGFNANNKVVNGTFTITVHGTGSDGSTFKVHETDHFNTTPTGAEFFFTHCHD
jgi:hypothetical protein